MTNNIIELNESSSPLLDEPTIPPSISPELETAIEDLINQLREFGPIAPK